MNNHNKAQQSKNRVHISWDILYANSKHNIEVPHFGYEFRSLCSSLSIIANNEDNGDPNNITNVPSIIWKTVRDRLMDEIQWFVSLLYITVIPKFQYIRGLSHGRVNYTVVNIPLFSLPFCVKDAG